MPHKVIFSRDIKDIPRTRFAKLAMCFGNSIFSLIEIMVIYYGGSIIMALAQVAPSQTPTSIPQDSNEISMVPYQKEKSHPNDNLFQFKNNFYFHTIK